MRFRRRAGLSGQPDLAPRAHAEAKPGRTTARPGVVEARATRTTLPGVIRWGVQREGPLPIRRSASLLEMSRSHRPALSLGSVGVERAGSRSGADEGGQRRRTEKRGDERARVFARVSHDIRQGQPAASSKEPATRLRQWVAGVGRHPRSTLETHRASGGRGPVLIRPRRSAWRRGALRDCSSVFIKKRHTRVAVAGPSGGAVSRLVASFLVRPARSLGARGTQHDREPERYRRQAARAGGRAGEETSEPVSPRACRNACSGLQGKSSRSR